MKTFICFIFLKHVTAHFKRGTIIFLIGNNNKPQTCVIHANLENKQNTNGRSRNAHCKLH